jgi:hypothetical protein
MTGDIGQEVESHFRGVGELKVHYHIAGGGHEMDALTRNKAEAELLALLQEFSSTIGAPFQIETKARAEGGVVELWNLVFLHKDHVVLAMSVLAPLLAAPFYRSRLKQSGQQTAMNELTIQKLRLELAEKEDAAVERAEKKRGVKTRALPFEQSPNPTEFADALLARKKIARRRSNYYERLIVDSKIQAVGFASTHHVNAQEQVVKRGQFSAYVFARVEVESVVYSDVWIEVVSPVLRSGGLKWRGVFEKQVISFDLQDHEFRDRVTTKRVQFQNGTLLRCDLEVLQREDETGDTEISGYVVSAVREVWNPPSVSETDVDLQLGLPLGTTSSASSLPSETPQATAPSTPGTPG